MPNIFQQERVLFVSSSAVHDSSSGHASEVKVILEGLAERNIAVRSLCVSGYKSRSGVVPFGDALDKARQDIIFFVVNDFHHHIRYEYLRMVDSNFDSAQLNMREMKVFHNKLTEIISEFRPDIILMAQFEPLDQLARYEAKMRGIPVVSFLHDNEKTYYNFPDNDALLCSTMALSNLYAKVGGIAVTPVGHFIDARRVVCPHEDRDKKYITMVSPSTQKGVGIFVRLIQMARKKLPEENFLVVDTYNTFESEINFFDYGTGKKLTMDDFPNVKILPNTFDMRTVYGKTKLLIAPSIQYEPSGNIAREALLNGIPVLASDMGGLPEALLDGGRILPLPECFKSNFIFNDPKWRRYPDESDVRSWFDTMADMLKNMSDCEKKAEEAAGRYDISDSFSRLLTALSPLLAKKAGQNPQILRGLYTSKRQFTPVIMHMPQHEQQQAAKPQTNMPANKAKKSRTTKKITSACIED